MASCVVYVDFSSQPNVYSVQRFYPSLNGVCLTCMGVSTHTALLKRVKPKACRLMNSPSLHVRVQSRKHRRNVASFYIFYRYVHGYSSSELANCMLLPFPQPCHTRIYNLSHPYCIHLINAKVKQHFFIPSIGKLWNNSWLCISNYLRLKLF